MNEQRWFIAPTGFGWCRVDGSVGNRIHLWDQETDALVQMVALCGVVGSVKSMRYDGEKICPDCAVEFVKVYEFEDKD